MKKLAFVFAGLITIAFVAPASADKIVINKKFGGPRAEMRMHRDHGWHRGWDHHHGSKKIIIKHGHDRY
jgi:hypothetical protein